MLKAVLFLACVAGTIVLVKSYDNDSPPPPPPRCPPLCPKNEEYYNCTGGCLIKRCSELGYPLDCNKECTPGCICKGGYLRRDDGQCVPTNDCPSCGDDHNAQQGCGGNCNKMCSDVGQPPRSCPPACRFNACDCRPGFWYDIKKEKCVKAEECRTPPTCPKNEVYYNCTGGCSVTRCSELGFPLDCKKCSPGCICKEGYLRRDDGKCVPTNDCPSCGGDDNAQRGCGTYCGGTCADIGKPPPSSCPIFCSPNGCACRPGFWYDRYKKKCVKAKECTPECPENEEYSSCINGGCSAGNCSQYGKPKIDPKYCIKGCICVEGYLRNSKGICVPKDKCKPKCDKPNEVFDSCSRQCPPRKCNVNNALIKCKAPPKPGDPDCIAECRCIDGYYQNATGTCVLKKKCEKPIPCGPNQHYNPCPGDCPPQVCGIDPDKVRCLIANPEYGDPRCRPGCECDDGYVRNKDNECVRRKDCPPECPANEEYSSCINGGCSARNCSQYGKPVPCVKIDPKYCIKGCICVEGYLRNSKGICVPKDKCKPKCDKPNEVFDSCSRQCPPRKCNVNNALIKCKAPPKPGDPDCIAECRCIDGYYRNATGTCVLKKKCEKPIPCGPNQHYNPCPGDCPPQVCGIDPDKVRCLIANPEYGDPRCRPGCECDDGYVRNKNNECVRRKDCPPECPANEEYSSCINGGCSARNCSQYGKPVPCVKIDPKYCIKGCICVEGYLRNSKGICVPKDKCKPKCDKPNEVFDSCSRQCPPRKCNVNNALIKCKAPPKPGDPDCIAECRCIDGYYRNATGTCVLKKKCEKPIPCGPNQHYNPCPGDCPPQVCGIDPDKVRCLIANPEYGDPRCRPGCECDDGYVRNKNNECVRRKDCPPECPANEEYSSCINGGCSARNCSQYGKPVPCVKIDPKYCIKGCICVEGYLRNSKGICVPKDKCKPKCNKPNEVFDSCSRQCPPRKCNVNNTLIKCKAPPKPGDPDCIAECRCIDGYYRNATGTCVLKKKCEKPIPCGPNQHYNPCPGDCPPQVCGIDPDKVRCLIANPEYGDPRCRPGCECDDGYVRNKDNECVRRKDCPPECPANEEYSSCINGGCRARNCSQYGKPVPCVKIDPKYCIKGCICVEGYLRNSKGICVPKDKCKPKCDKPNEVFDSCSRQCPPRKCNVKNALIKCKAPPKPGDPDCIAECRCIDDFYRNATGTCIPKKQCEKPIPCGPNQHYNPCPGDCPPQVCGIDPDKVRCLIANPEYGDPRCRPGCECDDGYVRNKDNECVRRKDCPPECPANEEYSSCINGGCSARNCSQYGKPVPCVKIDPKYCIKGCICVEGYLRNSKGICVPKDKCKPKCDKPNEVFDSCSRQCPPRKCNVKNALIKCKAPPKPGDPDCIAECRCIDDFYRNATGTCVPKKQCEKPIPCGKNQHYNACPMICPPQECGVNPALILCLPNPKYGDPRCRPGCVCVDGYLRDDSKECVPKDKCPPECPVNEQYSTCTNGGCDARNCSQLAKPVPCVRLDPRYCIKGCVCVKGYLRNSKGICIPKDECKPKCDKPNEVFDYCSPPCPPRRCNVKDALIKCAAPPKPGDPNCKAECRCIDTYYRNATGTCVPKKKCEKPIPCGPNQHYNPCPGDCPPQVCGIDPDKVRCLIANPEYGDARCKPGCECDDGYVRNEDNKCIRRKYCPPDCPANEKYSSCTNGGCGARNCSQYGKPVPCVKIDPKYCIKGCICVEGYLRNSKGICVPKDQCKPCPPKCGRNEVYNNCSNTYNYRPTKCSELGYPLKDQKCKAGCVCKDDYVRDHKSVCIPIKNCSSCGGDKHAESGCGNNCGRTCATYKKKQVICTLACKLNGCDCKKGYVYDPNQKRCVDPKDCTPTCKINEQYSDCINGGCGPRNCSQANDPIICIDPVPGACIKGCICSKGYLRAKNGTCVPKDQCPPPICKKNEEYSPCANGGCGPKNCSQINDPKICVDPRICVKGCVCKQGYLRAENGTCVPKDKCPHKCGENEHYESCIKTCGSQNCSDAGKSWSCPNLPEGKCYSSGCVCNYGYLRNASNVCIRQEKCPTPSCPPGQVWNWCPTVKCEGDYCMKTRDSPRSCPTGIVCSPPRCVCGYNSKIDPRTGKCIPIPKCPPFKCGCNEEYQACSTNCPGERCSDLYNKMVCPKIGVVVNCAPACKCIKGFSRDKNNNCIPACECPVIAPTKDS